MPLANASPEAENFSSALTGLRTIHHRENPNREMAQEIFEQSVEILDARSSPQPDSSSSSAAAESSLPRSGSCTRLNAGAPEFVPRAAAPQPQPQMVKVHQFHPPFLSSAPGRIPFEYYGDGGEGGGGGGGLGEEEAAESQADREPSSPMREGLSDEVIHKITKQVEYYFSDVNLATTEHLMRFINKDPEGFVPISVIASFKKIKTLVHNNSLLATALRTSSKLVVSDDGKKVRRQQPFTDADVEELQSRIVVAENLPEDHSYQKLMKIFSAAGSVKTIRTCYPQTPYGTVHTATRSTKMEALFGNRLHAFVEYETIEDAEKAIAELNDERNWRSGLRVRILLKCTTRHLPGRGRKGGHESDGNGEGNGEEDGVSISNQHNEKQMEDFFQPYEASCEHVGEDSFNDMEGGARRARGRGRGGKGRGRGQYLNINRIGSHAIGTPPSNHSIHVDQPAVAKPPPGPRMPDGTRGFTVGRGKPLASASTD